MRRLLLLAGLAVGLAALPGCGNLSPQANPKMDQNIDNQNGKIGEVESMQNSMKAELGKLQSQAEIANSRLDRLQQGLLNLQQNNDNHGVQILSGPGGLVVGAVVVVCLTVLVFHYRGAAKVQATTATILAERLVALNAPAVEDDVFRAVLHTPAAGNMLSLMKRVKAGAPRP